MKKIIVGLIIILTLGVGVWYYYKIYPRTQVDWLFDYKGTDKYEVLTLTNYVSLGIFLKENYESNPIIVIDSINSNFIYVSNRGYEKYNLNTNKRYYKERNLIDEGNNVFLVADVIMNNGTILNKEYSSSWVLDKSKNKNKNYYYGHDSTSSMFDFKVKNDFIIKKDSVKILSLLDSLQENATTVQWLRNSYFYINNAWHIYKPLSAEYRTYLKKKYPEKNENPRFFPLSMKSKKPEDLIKLYDYDAKVESSGYSWSNSWFSGGLGKAMGHGIRYNELYMPEDTLRFKNYGGHSISESIHLYTNDSLYYKYGIMFISLDAINKNADIPIPDRYKNGGLFLVRPRKVKNMK